MNNSDERDYAEEAANRRLLSEESDGPVVLPAEVRCPICHAGPGWYCRDLEAEGSPVLDEPHLSRVALAERTPAPVGAGQVTPDPRRAAFTAALREMADYLDAHPDLPLPSAAEVAPYLDGTDEKDRAEVDRIAGILGARPETTAGGHYRVSRTFGVRVTYQAVAIPDRQMRDWEALMSYRSAVTPVTAAEPVVPAAGGSTCPGHVGRGTGRACVVCGLPIPAGLRRTVDSPSELRPGCADCAAGRAHVHPGGVS